MSAGIADIPDVTRVQVGDKVEVWRKIGHKYHSTEHALYPWDPAVVQALQRDFDPTMEPLWVRNLYRRPNGKLIIFDRHVISVFDQRLEGTGLELTFGMLEWPYPRQRPNKVFDIIEVGNNPLSKDLPGNYGALDWGYFHETIHRADWVKFVQTALDGKTQEQVVEIITRARNLQKEKFWGDLKAEIDYRWDNDWDHSIAKTKEYFT